eukprot:sb/3478773/
MCDYVIKPERFPPNQTEPNVLNVSTEPNRIFGRFLEVTMGKGNSSYHGKPHPYLHGLELYKSKTRRVVCNPHIGNGSKWFEYFFQVLFLYRVLDTSDK